MTVPADSGNLDNLPEADVQVKGGGGVSLVWLVPLVAVVVGAWLVYKTYAEQGPTITIQFANAEGLEVGKTHVKYLDVSVGIINQVRLAKDGAYVEVEAEMVKGSKSKLHDATRFWVVRPRIEGTKISGIGTLLSGAYIGMDPGEAGGAAKRFFVGLDEPPKLLSHRKGTLYKLQAPRLGSISLGAPVYFRQIAVGDVVFQNLAPDHGHVDIEFFINAPHDQFVRTSSKFWNASGVSLEATSEGVNLEMESLASLVSGGIAFDSPDAVDARQAPEGAVFTLYDSEEQSKEKPIVTTYPYLVYFADSVRGLSLGAPVEFRGIRFGTVKDIRLTAGADAGEAKIAVLLDMEPERLAVYSGIEISQTTEEFLNSAKEMVAKGFRAQLQTGNLLTGKLFVDFDYHPDAAPAEVYFEDDYPVLPSLPTTLSGITDNLSGILAKLEALPLAEIGRHVEETAAGANRLVNGTDLKEAMAHLNDTLAKADALMATLNSRADPLLASATRVSTGAEGLVEAAKGAASQAEATLDAFENIASDDSPIGRELLRTLNELAGAARAIRLMAEYLERHPEALLKGKN